MRRRRDVWIESIRAVERESDTVQYALELLAGELARNPSALAENDLEYRDYQSTLKNREATYLMRLFAVFENGLREAWIAEGESTYPKTLDLLNAFASRCNINGDLLIETHRVRTFRNAIVHSGSEAPNALSLAECRRFLCRFFSYLPDTW